MDKSTTTLTCDNCDNSGFFIGRGGHLSTYCRRTGKPIPAYITLPTCNEQTGRAPERGCAMKPNKQPEKKYTMSELREMDESQLDEIIATRKYVKEGDRPCADRGAKMLLIIDKQKGWR